jgi:hypothetical protein
MPWGGDAPAVLAAQVDSGPPVGYGDMMQAPPPPLPQSAPPQAQWAGQAAPQQQQAGDAQAQQWGELEL